MDGLIGGLILAAISALTFLAYKHPKGYSRLHTILNFSAMLFFIALSGWYYGVIYGVSAVKAFIPAAANADAAAALKAAQPLPYWFPWVGLATVVYLFALTFLPRLLAEDDKPHDER